MDDETAQAIEQTKQLLEDAATFHLKSIPLPVAVIAKLIALAESDQTADVTEPRAA